MTLAGCALVIAGALVVAQGPRAAAKHKHPAPAAARTTTTRATTTRATTTRTTTARTTTTRTSAPNQRRVVPHPRGEATATARHDASPTRSSDPAPGPTSGAQADSNPAAAQPTTDATTGGGSQKAARTKVYTFGAMDVEGKLKTPQLLYFLNRVRLELDMSAPDRRSFMKELETTADDPSL